MREFLSQSSFFLLAMSLALYEVALLVKKRFKLAILNPLLISSLCIIALLRLLDVEYAQYETGVQLLTYMLTPVTVALAVPLYEQLSLLRKNPAAVLLGILAGVLTCLSSIFLLSRLFALDHQVYVSLLPKSITTAMAIGVSEEMGGVVSLTVAAIVLTGILGGIVAEGLLKLARIHDPVAKGLAIGTSAHVMGTAKALEMGQVEGAMSSLAIAVAGLMTVVLAPFFEHLI